MTACKILSFYFAPSSYKAPRVRERLKDVLRQYELREKHFDCVIRSKELEVLLSKARAEEQRQLVENERNLTITLEGQVSPVV